MKTDWNVSNDVERSALEALEECRTRWGGNLFTMLMKLSVQPAWVRKVIAGICHPEDRRLVAREVVFRSWAESDPEQIGPAEFRAALPGLMRLLDSIMPA